MRSEDVITINFDLERDSDAGKIFEMAMEHYWPGLDTPRRAAATAAMILKTWLIHRLEFPNLVLGPKIGDE